MTQALEDARAEGRLEERKIWDTLRLAFRAWDRCDCEGYECPHYDAIFDAGDRIATALELKSSP